MTLNGRRNTLIDILFSALAAGVLGCGLLLIASAGPGLPARADDGGDPFEELDRKKAQARSKRRSGKRAKNSAADEFGASLPPLLPPMNGVLDAGALRNGRGGNLLSGNRPTGYPSTSHTSGSFRGATGNGVERSELAPLPGTAGPGTTGPRTTGLGGARPGAVGSNSDTAYNRPPPNGLPYNDRSSPGQPPNGQPSYGAPTYGQPSNGQPFGERRRDHLSDKEPYRRGIRAYRSARLLQNGRELPGNVWRGLSMKATEELLGGLTIPPLSPAMHGLWRRMWLSQDFPGATLGQEADRDTSHRLALRLEALYRSGLVGDVAEVISSQEGGSAGVSASPLLAALHARALIGLGKRDDGCRIAKQALTPGASMPPQLKAQALLVMGYCAAASGNKAGAGLAADLARDAGVQSPLALAVLDAVANESKPRLEVPDRMTLLDYRFLQLVSSASPAGSLESAEPALVGALAADASAKPLLRLAAGERAARLNAISAETLAQIYRAQAFNPADIADPMPTRSTPPLRRALLLQAIDAERKPETQARLMSAFLRLAKKHRLGFAAAKMLAPILASLPARPRMPWLSETAIEIALISGDYNLARAWVGPADGRLPQTQYDRRPDVAPGAPGAPGASALGHWLALIDIADPRMAGLRGADLGALERLARRGRFTALQLHRLATVLDALEYNVPIPLWEAASRTPQPKAGHLPKTGVLPQLNGAAERAELGRVILLALQTLGPKGPLGAHMISLGDTIRALKRAGLEADARRLGLEALIAQWPRLARN